MTLIHIYIYIYIYEQFYALNLDELKRVTEKLKEHTSDDLVFDYDKISCTVISDGGEALLLSVPYSDGWKIYRNGEEIQGDYFEDCLISIPLLEGENDIELKYHIPGVLLGTVLTIIGMAATVGNVCLYRKRNNGTCRAAEYLPEKKD